ncbi:hypothetical protein [Burkholderia ubonensis]|nr:hypothetical protein [Burkholderia ubonensis]
MAVNAEQRKAAAESARNPFRTPDRRKQFDAMLSDYTAGKKVLIREDGRENRLNNIGEAFWRGFHGERFIWDTDAPLYVAYKAGVAIAKVSG